MFVRFMALSFGCLFASFAIADDNCKEISVSSQVDRCVEAARKEADSQLNASYQKLLARFESQQRTDPEQGKALVAMARESQRAWIKLRDTTCPLEAAEIEPGMAAHVTTINNCVARMSLERAAYLDTIVADEPGNVVDLNKVFLSGSQRFGDVVARYVSTFGSPCLTVQILAPNGGWRVLSSKRFCSFDGKSFWNGYASALFEDHAFAADGLHLRLSLFELRGDGEKRLTCMIPIQNEQIKELKCGAPESS
ncbi:lysozyme inhibitor LprI family protein [Pseudomonas glycinae]|uniref:lysozyme inhibitor LprI family protein n=1 Tax=Candidatus Pseudomonas auctus TaxID=3461260 RepID=UPI003B92134C